MQSFHIPRQHSHVHGQHMGPSWAGNWAPVGQPDRAPSNSVPRFHPGPIWASPEWAPHQAQVGPFVVQNGLCLG